VKTNPLGRTGLQISEIAFGAGDTGGLLVGADAALQRTVLQRAVTAGIDWIDTAALYGDGASEIAIGRLLPALAPRPQVSTKVRIERDDFGDIAGAIERGLTESLGRLRLERVALFQLHNQLGEAVGNRPALTPQDVLRKGGVADTFDRLKSQGLFHASGLTVAGDAVACIEVIDSGRFDAAQVYYNAVNPSAAWATAPHGWRSQDFAGVITACRRQHMGLLNIRVFAGGPLARVQRPERLAVLIAGTDVDNEMRCAAAVRTTLGDHYGTPAQTALRFTLANADLSTRVLGIASLAELDEALAAVAAGPLPRAAIRTLEALWANDFR
jgi:aryl-alcohol dehydrogenase-like predicted oxidoreductase